MAVRKKSPQLTLLGVESKETVGNLEQIRYVNKRGEFCPGCGHDQKLFAGLPEIQDGIVHRELKCSACDATWLEQFQLAGYARFRAGGKSSDKAARRKARREARKARS